MTPSEINDAIDVLAEAVRGAHRNTGHLVRGCLRDAARLANVPVSGLVESGRISYDAVQEYALTAARALCVARRPPALDQQSEHDLALERARRAIEAAWECACGRRAG